MCRLRNIAMRDYRTDTQADRRTDRHAGQSDPYVPLCFAGDTKINVTYIQIHSAGVEEFPGCLIVYFGLLPP